MSCSFSLRPLRISAFSALNGRLNAENAEIRRERRVEIGVDSHTWQHRTKRTQPAGL